MLDTCPGGGGMMCEMSKCGKGAKREATDRSHKSWSTPEIGDVTGRLRLVPTQSPLSGAKYRVFWGMYSRWAERNGTEVGHNQSQLN